MTQSSSDQFNNSLLVAAYDTLNAFGDDADFWLTEIERLSPKTIIDLGCGTGLLTCELAKRGYNMIGVEPAPAMLEVAKRKLHADEVQWIEGGYEKFNGLKADMVLMTSHVAQFFLDDKEWKAMLDASYKVLNPGGHLVFDSRNSLVDSFKHWPTEDSKRKVIDPVLGPIEYWCVLLENKDGKARYELHYHFLNSNEVVVSTDTLIFRSQEEIAQSLKEAGFSIEKIYGDWTGALFTAASPEMIFVASAVPAYDLTPLKDGRSQSLEMCKQYLGKKVSLVIDQAYGTFYKNALYEANYGYIPGTTAPDGKGLDAYFLGPKEPLEKAEGVCIAIIHRLDDDDDKLIVVPEGISMTDEEINTAVNFREKFFKHIIVK